MSEVSRTKITSKSNFAREKIEVAAKALFDISVTESLTC